MDKKTIVVVGAGKGMGNHIAEEFGKNDFRVVLMARRQESLDSYVKEFEEKGMEAYGIAADAADTDSLTKAFDEVKERFVSWHTTHAFWKAANRRNFQQQN